MKTRNTLLVMAVLLFASAMQSAAKDEMDEVFSSLKKKYKEIKSIELQFHRNGDGVAGTLKAKTGQKYFLDMKDRAIICNGKTIWNYSKRDKSVVISNYEGDKPQMSIEEFFFSFLDNYQPAEIKQIGNGEDNSGYLLTLKPSAEANAQYKEVKLKIDTASSIKHVEVTTDSGTEGWEIKKLLTKKLSDKIFEFTPPDNTQVIDLR